MTDRVQKTSKFGFHEVASCFNDIFWYEHEPLSVIQSEFLWLSSGCPGKI